MKDAGITAPVPRGDWLGNVNYYFLNIVNHNGISWIAKRENMGQEPSDGLYWQRFGTSVPIATTSVAGIVKPDGTTISVGLDGTIEVKIDGESIFIDDEDDKIKAKLSTLADVDITDLEDGYVLAWDATAEKFVAVEKGGGGIFPKLIVLSDTGSTVTATKGQTVITLTETSTGHFEGSLETPNPQDVFGTWTIDAVLAGDDAQVSVNVDTIKVYTVDDSHFHADITVTFPSGATCSCAKSGTTTQYATTTPYTFIVHEAGTYTISATDSTSTDTETVTITTSGQTESVTLSFVPDGSTVTPTDNIQTLLHCADVWDKAYTTLADLLNDSSSLLAVTSSNNAVDYLVRSTTFASDMCSNSTAMTDIGANNYCANTLLEDSTWFDAICDSTYFESVLNVKVPTMTSNTTPSGQASSSDSSASAHAVFDNDTSTMWEKLSGSSSVNIYQHWLRYQFTEPKVIKMVKMSFNYIGQTRNAVMFKVQGSNDGSDFADIYTDSSYQMPSVSRAFDTKKFMNSTPYEYCQVWFNGSTQSWVGGSGSNSGTQMCEVQFYGREDV